MSGGGSRFRRLVRIVRPAPRREVEEELAFHFESRVADYMARGLDRAAAEAAARARLGDLAAVRGECTELLAAERRGERRREWLKVSALDFKLGLRMLVKYPGLTVIGGLAMAFAIWVGAGTFEFVRQVMYPSLPLPQGEQVVGVLVMDRAQAGPERRVASDFREWRDQLRTITQLSAFRPGERNLVGRDGLGQPVSVAEMSASGFDVARVPPLLGRRLLPADERPGAARVVVLGHEVWQQRFAGDSSVVGRSVRLGTITATVVGVMPEGFGFPLAQSLWLPLGQDLLEQRPRGGPGLFVFGRLAPGASMAEAQAELDALGLRARLDRPDTHQHLQPRVLPYARSIFYLPVPATLGLHAINLMVALLLVLICGNVALLMFARAATRESEIVVRNALGASRGRIIMQLFVEALVLGTVAAALGLAAAGFGLRWLFSTVMAELSRQTLPFWFAPRLSLATIGYTVLLTLLAAAIAGVVPALKVTGRRVDARLRQASAGGGGLRFGGIWTAVIVLQVAVTVATPAFALIVRGEAQDIREMEVGFPAEEYLSVRLDMDRASSDGALPGWAAELAGVGPGTSTEASAGAAFARRYAGAVAELERRLEARSDVVAVTFGERLPRMYHPHRLIEIDEGGAAPKHPQWPAYRVSSVAVATDYFDALGVPILHGRAFHPGDLAEDARTVIVNESFVELVLGGRNPIGRRLQYVYFEEEDAGRSPETQPWYEIIGVVRDLGLSYGDFDPKRAGIYHAVAPGGSPSMHAAVHVRGDPDGFAHALRTLATQVDPSLRLHEIMPLDRIDESELRFYSFWLWMLALVCGVALTLSLAGIYAIMSFAVSRRTREIGIRVALGARHGRVLAAVLRRPMIQVACGLVLGAALLAALAWAAEGDPPSFGRLVVLAAYMAIMTAVCALACIVPTRRALAVAPTDALRAE